MGKYGIPYMGSKGSICDKITRIFPKADNFYDLFGGGFSVTHAMLLNRPNDFKQFHFNELRSGICELIEDAIAGKYSYDNFKPSFISRDEFFEKKDTDPYIKICWSFGNNGKAYMFSKEIEPYKKSMHNAIIFNEFDDLAKKTLGIEKFKEAYSIKDRRFFLRNRVVVKNKGWSGDLKQSERLQPLQQLEPLLQLERLQQMERLQQLERLQQMEQLAFYSSSYNEVPIKENSIIYCDPPYKGTADYDSEFNHEEFLDWCHYQKNPVFISEYNIDDSRFKKIWEEPKLSRLTSKSREIKKEKVYANRAALKILFQKKLHRTKN